MTHEAAIQHEFEKQKGKQECGIEKIIIVLLVIIIILLILMKIVSAVGIVI